MGLGEMSLTLSVGMECPLLRRTDTGRSHKPVGDCRPTFSFASRRREPTWDDCQQLLQILFTTEERERIQAEARKKVPGANGEPTNNIDEINASFPLSRPEWDFKTAQGKERLRVYRQVLLEGLKAAARKPADLARVGDVQQGPTKSPATFLERLMEAFRQYTPMDPEADNTQAALIMHFINQAAPDIRRNLQKLERLGEKTIQDLVTVAERICNTRETPEEKQAKAADRQMRNMARILLAASAASPGERERQIQRLAAEGKDRPRMHPPLGKNQCAYCKEEGHWAKECPKKKKRQPKAPILAMDELSD
ncbi:uncharacterized protein LOC129546355 isoform X2 [Moschus berezovskii]|uniref:uncharacterized protein LOC129546355 isoform X2 n=1 Tax=Moschus berezovskii TaxID=68408 RepID=UPI0024441DC8|nr:uncharacterized protein LOC129546355 isoform X2 [Moschus berezovskii]XP_055267221.1 uncharacterized protein LOC129546355 isoform X2 [Moschus berezovskii]